jgi:hypothetical protein
MKKINFIYCILTILLVFSCSIDRKQEVLVIQGIDGNTSLISTISEPLGVNCTNGGIKLTFGIDISGDGILQNDEITTTSYVCNGIDGEDGQSSLIRVEPVNGTTDYPQGGINVYTGLDFNNNGILDENEITHTFFIANGESGINGYSTLVKTTVIEVGTIIGDSSFEQGGFIFESGLDINRNSNLDLDEVTYTEYIENGVDGLLVQIRTTEVTGGTLLETGLDVNGNGILDNNEVLTSNVILNGTDGTNGFNSLITTEDIDEGIIIKSGLDVNQNNILDSEEVMSTSTILDGAAGINGENGFNSLVNLEQVPPNSTFPTGGVKIATGLDTNNNNTLEISEVNNIAFIANGRNGNDGTNGTNGQNGLNSLVNIIKNTPNTLSTTIQTGIDLDNNGILESNEVTNSVVIQDGENGKNGICSFVVVVDEPVGSNCQFGGIKVTTGKDLNNNKIFDTSEIEHTEYVCEWRPCVEVIKTEVVIDFEEFTHGFYTSSKGVAISTSNGCNKRIKVLAETSTFGQNTPKFGYDANNMVGIIANCSGMYLGGGGLVFFNFSEPTDLVSINFLDSDHRTDNKVKVFFANGNTQTIIIPKVDTEHSNQVISLPFTDVIKVQIHSCESFALDSLRFKKTTVVNNCN